MVALNISYTESGSLYNSAMPPPTKKTWDEFCQSLSHLVLRGPDTDAAKHSTPTYCPGLFEAPGRPRENRHVVALQLVVFDVDSDATGPKVDAMMGRLKAEGLLFAFHTTYRHTEERPAYRLIVPLAEPLPPSDFAVARDALFEALQPPALKRYGDDVSRCFFYPSTHSSRAAQSGVAYELQGKPYTLPEGYVPSPAAPIPPKGFDAAIQETTTLVTVGDARKAVQGLLKKLEPHDARRGMLLRLLEGHKLAERGSRDSALQSVVSYLVFSLPDEYAVETYTELLMPSLKAMEPYDEPLPAVVSRVQDKVRRAHRDKLLSREARRAEEEAFMHGLRARLSRPLPKRGEMRAKMLEELRTGRQPKT